MDDGYLVARSFVGNAEWDLLAGYAARPQQIAVRQHRQANPGRRVRVFTEAEWDALPIGEQSSDWVWHANTASLRWADGVRGPR